MAIIALSGALTATAVAQSGVDSSLSSNSEMERVVIVMPDGSRTVRWVRKSSAPTGQQRGGFRISSPLEILGGSGSGGDDGAELTLLGPFMPPGDGERKDPLDGGVVGESYEMPPPDGNGGGDGGGGDGGGGDGGGGDGGGGQTSGEIIYPGSGFGGATPQPGDVGASGAYGHDAKAIARWDVVPFREFDSTFNIGVIAFHMAGIDRVEFIAEGGTPVSIGEPTLNPRTGVVEYWGTLQASDFQDTQTEIRAIAYPLAGEPRVLDSLYLYPNHNGGLEEYEFFVNPNTGSDHGRGSRTDPFASIHRALIEFKNTRTPGSASGPAASGYVTLLREGDYQMPNITGSWGSVGNYEGSLLVANDRWITIRADAGLERDNLIIGAVEHHDLIRAGVTKLAFRDVSFDFDSIKTIYAEPGHSLWFDHTRWFNPVGWGADYADIQLPTRTHKRGVSTYTTDSYCHDWLYAFTHQQLVRNSVVERCSGDVFQNTYMVVNCTIDDVDGTARSHHSDLFQYFGNFENVIVYGVKATNVRNTQNFFFDGYQSTFDNCAFVNVLVENLNDGTPYTQNWSRSNHMLFYHISNPRQRWVLRDDVSGDIAFQPHNIVFRNNVLEQLARGGWGNAGIPAGVEARNNHFVDPAFAHGTNLTTGAVRVSDLPGVNFSYTGSAEPLLHQSGDPIPDLYVPDWAYGTMLHPNRGAFPFSQNDVSRN